MMDLAILVGGSALWLALTFASLNLYLSADKVPARQRRNR